MSGQHAPGPWRIEGRRGNGYIISHGVNAEADGPAGYVGVLDPMFYVAGEGDHAANARVICAAPDMLAALLSVQQSTEWWCMETDTQDAVLAAIAKATTPTSGEAQ